MSTHPVGSQVEGLRLPISRLVLGTMTFGDTADEATAARMVEEAIDAGITTIDTANAYVGGVTEDMLGRLLKGKRDGVILASKAGMPHADHGGNSPLSPTGLRASVEASLRRLGVDSIDLFYLHQPDRATPLAATLTTIAELVDEGKLGALGVSNFAAWQVADVIHTAREVGAPQPVVAQQLYNLVARRLEEEYLELPPRTTCTQWSTTRWAVACLRASTASTPGPQKAATATPSLLPCIRSGIGTSSCSTQ